MVRSRSYDEDEVLARAMHAFRREGYAGISIPQLEAATGLSSGSIYNSFGDKRGIFFAAFEHYVQACSNSASRNMQGLKMGFQGFGSSSSLCCANLMAGPSAA